MSEVEQLTHSRSEGLLQRNSELIPGGLASINRRVKPCIAFANGFPIASLDRESYFEYHGRKVVL